MLVKDALDLINGRITYKPGWRFEATDHTNRFEGAIAVKIHYPAKDSSTREGECEYPVDIETYASFCFSVTDCTEEAVMFHLGLALLKIESHEMREFLRVIGSIEPLYHPHRVKGINLWLKHADDCCFQRVFTADDMLFGVA